MISASQQLEELKRGTDEILSEKDLLTKLQRSISTGKPLSVKAGFDPTAPDIHLGHTVLMQKMAQFQKFGHRVIFLIGDFTGIVGDPSGKSRTRPQLTKEEVLANAETYKKQVFKILDKEKTVIQLNSDWLGRLTAYDFVKLASHANVARMLEREDFNRRYKEGQSISVHEFLYPLLQAYDSVVLQPDVELGGKDQKFNLLLGRELMRDYGLEPQVCLTVPLLEGLDGVQKMSKTLNNYVGVDEPADEMYGKLMSLPDALMRRYYDLLSGKGITEIETMFREMVENRRNPRDVKSELACEIVARYHDEQAAQSAKDKFHSVFSKKEIPKDITEFSFKWDGKEVWLPKLLLDMGFVPTTSEGKRLVSQGAVRIDETVMKEEKFVPKSKEPLVIQCGKRRFGKVTFR